MSLGLAGWMVSTLAWSAVGAHLGSMRWWPWIAAAVVSAAHFALRAWRWAWMFPGQPSSRKFALLVDTIMIGNFASYILPLRAGEIIRPAAYARLSESHFLPAFTTVVVERLFDLTAVLFSLAVVVAILPEVPSLVTNSAVAMGIGAVALALFVAVGVWQPNGIRMFVRWCTTIVPHGIAAKIRDINEQVLTGVAALREQNRLAVVILQTGAVWLSAYLQFWICLYAFDIPGTSFLMAVTVAVILALGVAAPSAPGFVGVYEVSCLMGFRLFGVNDELAVAYAITTHAFQYLIVIGYGAFALFKYDLKLADFKSSAAPQPPAA